MNPDRLSPPRASLSRRVIRYCGYAFVGGIFLVAIGVLNNNFSLRKPSLAEFQTRLDRSILDSTDWVHAQPSESNGYLTFMVQDCVEMSGEPKLARFVKDSMGIIRQTYMARLVEPHALFFPPPSPWIDTAGAYHRWLTHAISREEYPLSAEDKTAMFEPDRARTGKATHQLFALLLYRRYQGATPALDQLIRHISLRIAQEAALDFRVTDLYLQRISFLLAAGQADLVKPRWVERALAAQDSSGGWYWNWFGWAPTPYLFGLEDTPHTHPTIQGLWLTYMLKYRFPDWSRRHYR